jgi:predicted DCC family thiol-disulfide oxidoreductase YuxK
VAERRCAVCDKILDLDDQELCPDCFNEAADNLNVQKKDDGNRALPIKFDQRCPVCTHEKRRMIERLAIMPNVSFTEIGETFDVPRRSVSKHLKKHLNHEDAAIRRVIEQEAEALQMDAEEGVKGALSRRVFLSTYIQRSLEALIDGDLELTGKDAMNAILLQDKLDQQSGGAAVDEIHLQFQSFMQAIRELSQFDIEAIQTPMDLQKLIYDRTKEILGREAERKQLEK